MKEYEKSGVSISKGDELVSRIKSLAKSTFTSGVLSDIGHFGGMFSAEFSDLKNPVLVSSVDGVGTKLKIAILAGKHNTIGQCLVNHSVNDILCTGARPLFFLDYLAFGKLNVDVAEEIIKGFSLACKDNNCALIGGETAEMPGVYSEEDYDISGTIVGVVDRANILDGSKIKVGNILLGLPSNGLHTNGYSLARKVLLEKYTLNDFIPSLNTTLVSELLKIHKSYLNSVYSLLTEKTINGISHITGGGIVNNTRRIVPDKMSIKINWNAWEIPAIFSLIQKEGKISIEEMREVFNLGIGMILIIDREKCDYVRESLKQRGQESLIIGVIE